MLVTAFRLKLGIAGIAKGVSPTMVRYVGFFGDVYLFNKQLFQRNKLEMPKNLRILKFASFTLPC